jgi:hypothetical protein
MTGITSITIPNSVMGIGQGAFQGMTNLTTMSVPFVGASRTASNAQGVFGFIFGYVVERVNRSGVGSTTFIPEKFGYYWVNSFTWQYTMQTSSNNSVRFGSVASFYYFIPDSLKTITITDATKIDVAGFMNMTNVTSVTINSGITSIGNYAFAGMTSITSITIPNTVTTISGNSTFSGSTNLTIYSPLATKPSGWVEGWNSSRPIVWNHSA